MLTYALDKQAGLSLYEQLYRRPPLWRSPFPCGAGTAPINMKQSPVKENVLCPIRRSNLW